MKSSSRAPDFLGPARWRRPHGWSLKTHHRPPRFPAAQIRAQAGLIQRDAGGVCGHLQLLQPGGDVGRGVAPRCEVLAQDGGLDGAIALARVPVAEVAIAEAVGPSRVGEEPDNAVLRATL